MTDKDDLQGAAGLSMRQIIEEEESAASTEDDDTEDDTTPRVSIKERVIADGAGGPVKTGEWDFDIPSMVAKYLKADESRAVPLRQHQALLIGPALAFGGGLGVAIGLNMAGYASGHASPGLVHLLWLLWLTAAGWALWRYHQWRQTWFVITGHRIMLIETTRTLGRKITMLPIDKLRDTEYTQTLTGRATGYATFRFTSIGTERALNEVKFMPFPEWVYQQISELTMPAEGRKAIKRNRGASS
jgi:hypothetical protein